MLPSLDDALDPQRSSLPESKALTSSPMPVWRSVLEAGLCAIRHGALDEARQHFERALKAAPGEPLVMYALGRELARDGYCDRVDELLRAAWEADNTLVGAAATLARSAGLHGGELTYAHEWLDRATAAGFLRSRQIDCLLRLR